MEYVHPDDRDTVAKQWQAAKEGEPYDIEHRIVTDAGETKWVRTNGDVEFDDAGNPVSAVGIVQDITERKQREWDLRRFRRAIQASAHSIYITDCNGTIEYVNPAFERTTGYSAEEAVGRTPAILRSEANDEELYEEMWDTILEGDTWHGELINTTKQGDRYVVNKTIAPVTDDSDETTHFVSVNADVTEMRKQQDELHRLWQAIDKAHMPLTMTDPAKDGNPMV